MRQEKSNKVLIERLNKVHMKDLIRYALNDLARYTKKEPQKEPEEMANAKQGVKEDNMISEEI